MKTITVKVTQEHIDEARALMASKKWGPATCPIALALRSSGVRKALFFINYWTADKGLYGTHLIVSDPAKAFARAFDHEKPVKPQTFRLQAPEPSAAGAGPAKGAE